jgi:hypothetical protein
LPKRQTNLDRLLDTFFHLPTLIVLALLAVIIVWQMYQVELDVGAGFIRLKTNQGNITLHWQTGCCHLEW